MTRQVALEDLLTRWATPEGRPFKGSLIDWSTYNGNGVEPPDNIGCMCAQGQALHILAGWTPLKLRNTDQSDADEATAKLFNISRTHAVLLRHINDTVDGAPSIVLTNPKKILGDQTPILLAFWSFLDTMTSKQWNSLSAARDAAGAAARYAARDAARDAAGAAAGAAARYAARDAAWAAARDAAWDAAWDATWDTAWDAAGAAARYAARDAARDAAATASNEIQGVRIMRERGKPFFFLPMFGFTSPEDIPPLPDGYGVFQQKGNGNENSI